MAVVGGAGTKIGRQLHGRRTPIPAVDPRHRDGALALGTLAALVVVSAGTGLAVDPLDPAAAAAGVAGALALEAAFLRRPDRTRALWERPAVQAASVVLVVGVALLAAGTGRGAFVVAALGWGLVAYLALLAAVLAGDRNPVALLVGRG
jgi:hypothetical protein